MIKALEKKIIGKINAVKNGTVTPKESGIAALLNRLKLLDEPLYIELLHKYKNVLRNLDN
jgi:hypothetical protein